MNMKLRVIEYLINKYEEGNIKDFVSLSRLKNSKKRVYRDLFSKIQHSDDGLILRDGWVSVDIMECSENPPYTQATKKHRMKRYFDEKGIFLIELKKFTYIVKNETSGNYRKKNSPSLLCCKLRTDKEGLANLFNYVQSNYDFLCKIAESKYFKENGLSEEWENKVEAIRQLNILKYSIAKMNKNTIEKCNEKILEIFEIWGNQMDKEGKKVLKG